MPTATIDTGSGASTRSSISLVYPNSCTMGRATAWMPWNMMDSPTTPATRTDGELGFGGAGPPDGRPDLGEHVEEDEHQQERLEDGARDEDAEVLAQDREVAQEESLEGGQLADVKDPGVRRQHVGWSESRVAISRAAPFRSG